MSQDLLSQLANKEQIATVITRLFTATDKRDWGQIHELMADAVRFDMSDAGGGKPTDKTPQAITESWEALLRPLWAVHHQVGDLIIHLVNDNQAEATCYGIAYHYLPNVTGKNTRIFVGDYIIGLEKTDIHWKITAFAFHLKFIDGNTELEKSAK
jgi:hypothetical protein